MVVVADIPTRNGEDGARQLLLLSSYLKDVSKANYTDAMLIPLLIVSDKVTVWRNLMGAQSTAIPWSYTPDLSTPVSRIRFHIGDIDETNMRRSDYELLRTLEVIPLRYVIALVKLSGATGKTAPSDPNHPITIMHYMDGEDVEPADSAYSDGVIADLLLTGHMNPFELALRMFDANVSSTVMKRSSTVSGGSGFASLDGISFAKEGQADQLTSSQRDADRRSIEGQLMASIYNKDDPYGVWVDGEEVTASEDTWYEI